MTWGRLRDGGRGSRRRSLPHGFPSIKPFSRSPGKWGASRTWCPLAGDSIQITLNEIGLQPVSLSNAVNQVAAGEAVLTIFDEPLDERAVFEQLVQAHQQRVLRTAYRL